MTPKISPSKAHPILTSSAGTRCWTFRPCRHAGDKFSPRFRPRPRRCLKCRSTSTWTWFLGIFFSFSYLPEVLCFRPVREMGSMTFPPVQDWFGNLSKSLLCATLCVCVCELSCLQGKIGEESERFVPMWFSLVRSPLALVVMLEE